MRVVSHTSEMLIVEDRPFLWAILLALGVLLGIGVFLSGLMALDLIRIFWGGGFAALALVMFALILRRVRIYFDRGRNLVELRTRTLRGTTRQKFRLQDLEQALVQISAGKRDMFRLALAFTDPDRVIPTRRAYDSGPSSQRAADAINGWLGR